MSFAESEAASFSLFRRPAAKTPAPVGVRDLAIEADAVATEAVGLAEIWHALVEGTLSVVDGFFTAERCGLVFAPLERTSARPLVGRRLLVLESILRGVRQKRIAIELDFAPSTVALDARSALARLGVSGRPSRVHPLLMLAATAAQTPASDLRATRSYLRMSGVDLVVVGMPRPDSKLEPILPRAELDVVRHLVEGDCYAKISTERGTSSRTIANQIAAVFRRFNVSGRSELLHQLFGFGGGDIDTSVGAAKALPRA